MTRADVWLLVLALVLVALAAYFSAADAALSRVSKVTADEMAREGLRGAARLEQVLADRARYINVALFLRVVCSVAATVIVTVVLLDVLPQRWQGMLVAVAVMVVVEYVLIGVGPRTLGRQYAPRLARSVAGPVRALAVLLGPVTSLLILVGNAITPGRGFREGPFSSEAELRELVDLAERDRLIEDDERQMIHSVFELGDTLAREVMVPRPDMVVIEKGKTLRQGVSLALRSGFSRIPVVGENIDDVLGVVYLKDLTRRVYEHRDAEQSERVEQHMRPASFVPDSKPVDELLREMQAQRSHVAIVVDEWGGTAGLVTIEDILEEIVGEITDEYDTEGPEVERLADGDLRVNARMNVEDFAELVGLELDDEDTEDVDTVGGLLQQRLGRVPIAGSSVQIDGLRLVAESLAGRRNRIGAVLVQRPDGGPVLPVEPGAEQPAGPPATVAAADA